MPSPDATPYVDLTVFDRDAQEMFESAIANVRAYLPDWQPREGHTEVVLLEAMALLVAESVFAINRVPGAVVEVLLRLYGIERDPGAPPTGTVRFTFGDDSGYTVPAGTRLAVPIGASEETVVFTTDEAVVAPEGSGTVDAAVTAETNTALLNTTPPGSTIELLDSLSSVDRVDLVSTIANGLDPEDDADWFTRGAQRFGRLSETLVLPRHFVAAALEVAGVERAFARDNYDSDTNAATPGHVTVAVYGPDGAIPAADKAALRTLMDSQAQANLAVHVTDPTVTPVTVTATVVALPGYTADQVREFCLAALGDYLSTDTWPWESSVYANDVISLLSRVEGVLRVATVTAPAAGSPTQLPGIAPLATLDAASQITVTLP